MVDTASATNDLFTTSSPKKVIYVRSGFSQSPKGAPEKQSLARRRLWRRRFNGCQCGKNWSRPDPLRPAPEHRTTQDLNGEASDFERSWIRHMLSATGRNLTPGRQTGGAKEA